MQKAEGLFKRLLREHKHLLISLFSISIPVILFLTYTKP